MTTGTGDGRDAAHEILGTPPGGDPPQVIEAGPIHFTVNGKDLTQAPGEDLTAEEILRMAKEKGAFTGSLDQYTLEALDDKDKGVYAPGVKVTPKEGERFLAVPSGPTPVA